MRALILALALAACGQTNVAEAPPNAETPATIANSESRPASVQDVLAQMPSWENARAQGVDFRAVGQEPGWILDIYTRGIIKFAWDYGEQYGEFAIAEPTSPQEGMTRYEANSDGRALVVTIRRFPCEDDMSGEAYPSTVEVTIDGRTLSGCGRSV